MRRALFSFCLLVSLVAVSLLLLWSGAGQAQSADSLPLSAPPVIINEWSQGPSGSKEWVELLVVDGPADLRGWDLGDNVPGRLTFSADSLWQNLPSGTLIVIHNAADPDPLLPPFSADPADFLLVLPHNSPGRFSGSWPAFSNSDVTDNPILRDAGGTVIHDYSVAPGATTALRPGGGQSAHFTGANAADIIDSAWWNPRHPATAATPGGGNAPLNSAWVAALRSGEPLIDVALSLDGPVQAAAGAPFSYQLSVQNSSPNPAPQVVLTVTLSADLAWISHTGGVEPSQPVPGTLVWSLGTVQAGQTVAFDLTVQSVPGLAEVVTSTASVTTSAHELNEENNHATSTSRIGRVALITALHYHALNTYDQAVQLLNRASQPLDVGGWVLGNSPTGGIRFPAGTTLPPGTPIWITDSAHHFRVQFGFSADYSRLDLIGAWPGFANTGSQAILRDAHGNAVDTLVYGVNGETTTIGWSGVSVRPWTGGGVFATQGQILYRKLDQQTGLPVADTDTARDWAQSADDPINGRRVRYPGWDLEQFFFTPHFTQTATLTVSISPDNSFQTVRTAIESAETSLHLQTLTFTNHALNQALNAAAGRGVEVILLQEGSPPGGILDQQRALCQRLEAAGGQCWFSINESAERIYDRYRFLHAKYMLIDGERVLISTDNFSGSSMPFDDFSDGTSGRRGVLLLTDAPGVVAHVQALWSADFDPAHHAEMFRWAPHHPLYGNRYGLPAYDFIPEETSGGYTYTIRYPDPAVFHGEMGFELVQSPETSLRTVGSLLGLVNRAGAGDALYVQQLNERPWWGAGTSNPVDDPNPRLEAYLAAARRGAEVWLLLDEYHVTEYFAPEEGANNIQTCLRVNALAQAERLRLRCQLGLPADLGIHSKIVLAEIGGRGYIHVGSLNGTEMSSKGNRELALQVQSDEAFAYLRGMFLGDWSHRLWLPLLYNGWIGPADHVLISEVWYDPPGAGDEKEFIELANPTGVAVDISGWTISDAVNPDDFEDMRLFPPGTVIGPQQTLVIAFQATAFEEEFGRKPDFEIWPSDPLVPVLEKDPRYGHPNALLRLGNQGDEVILRRPDLSVVDVVTYGMGHWPGVVPAPLVPFGASLERYPWWRDTDDGSVDFRPSLSPSPGLLPAD